MKSKTSRKSAVMQVPAAIEKALAQYAKKKKRILSSAKHDKFLILGLWDVKKVFPRSVPGWITAPCRAGMFIMNRKAKKSSKLTLDWSL